MDEDKPWNYSIKEGSIHQKAHTLSINHSFLCNHLFTAENEAAPHTSHPQEEDIFQGQMEDYEGYSDGGRNEDEDLTQQMSTKSIHRSSEEYNQLPEDENMPSEHDVDIMTINQPALDTDPTELKTTSHARLPMVSVSLCYSCCISSSCRISPLNNWQKATK